MNAAPSKGVGESGSPSDFTPPIQSIQNHYGYLVSRRKLLLEGHISTPLANRFCKYISTHKFIGVPGGPTRVISRVTMEVEVVGSNRTRDSLFQIDRPKARERELAKINENRRA